MRTSLLLACLLLAACGQKGNLYLPEESRPVVVPATPQASPAAPADNNSSQSDEERRKREQQTAPTNDNTGN